MSITTKTEKQSKHLCGFCSTGHHDLCPGGILNGNLTEVVLCGCDEHPIHPRCLDCNNREADEVNRETWTCIDVEACSAKALYGGRAPEVRHEAEKKAAKAPAKPKGGKCLCCGETTGGGLFRPGHDARYLSAAVKAIQAGERILGNELDRWAEQGISEALQAKLTKRVS